MLGSGDPEAERFFSSRARSRSDRFCAWFPFDDGRAHRIQAGADFLVMPSRFEPCGLSQLYAMRYGTLPIVRATGGLADTVGTYDEAPGPGTGFAFHDLRPDSLADTVGWAVSTWYDRPSHIEVMRHRAMAQDHSWDRAASEYAQLYLAAYARRRGHGFPEADVRQREGMRSAERREVLRKAPQRPQRAPCGEVAAHPVDSASGRGRRRADEEARVRRRVGVESGHGPREELPEIGDTPGDRTPEVIGIIALEIGGAHRVARENAVAESGSEALGHLLD